VFRFRKSSLHLHIQSGRSSSPCLTWPHIPPSPLSIKVVNSSTNSYLRTQQNCGSPPYRPRGSGWPTRAHQDIWWTVTFFTFWSPKKLAEITSPFLHEECVGQTQEIVFNFIFRKKIAGNWSAVLSGHSFSCPLPLFVPIITLITIFVSIFLCFFPSNYTGSLGNYNQGKIPFRRYFIQIHFNST
jgi:hypothetical protein